VVRILVARAKKGSAGLLRSFNSGGDAQPNPFPELAAHIGGGKDGTREGEGDRGSGGGGGSGGSRLPARVERKISQCRAAAADPPAHFPKNFRTKARSARKKSHALSRQFFALRI